MYFNMPCNWSARLTNSWIIIIKFCIEKEIRKSFQQHILPSLIIFLYEKTFSLIFTCKASFLWQFKSSSSCVIILRLPIRFSMLEPCKAVSFWWHDQFWTILGCSIRLISSEKSCYNILNSSTDVISFIVSQIPQCL